MMDAWANSFSIGAKMQGLRRPQNEKNSPPEKRATKIVLVKEQEPKIVPESVSHL